MRGGHGQGSFKLYSSERIAFFGLGVFGIGVIAAIVTTSVEAFTYMVYSLYVMLAGAVIAGCGATLNLHVLARRKSKEMTQRRDDHPYNGPMGIFEGYGEYLPIIHHPAECWSECDEPGCPYHHWQTWEVDGKHYSNYEDALKASYVGENK